MPRIYAFNTGARAIAAADVPQDLFEVQAASNTVVYLHKIAVTQHADTDSEQLHLRLHRSEPQPGSSGSGGITLTPAALDPGDPDFKGTVEANNQTQAVSGTTIWEEDFNILPGYNEIPIPEDRLILSGTGRAVLSLDTDPNSSIFLNAGAYIEEIG